MSTREKVAYDSLYNDMVYTIVILIGVVIVLVTSNVHYAKEVARLLCQ